MLLLIEIETVYTLRPIGYFSLLCSHNLSHIQSSAYFLYCQSTYKTLHDHVLLLMTPFSAGDQPGTDTILGVVVGIAMFLLLVVLVGLIVLAVLLKRRAAHMQTASIKMR